MNPSRPRYLRYIPQKTVSYDDNQSFFRSEQAQILDAAAWLTPRARRLLRRPPRGCAPGPAALDRLDRRQPSRVRCRTAARVGALHRASARRPPHVLAEAHVAPRAPDRRPLRARRGRGARARPEPGPGGDIDLLEQADSGGGEGRGLAWRWVMPGRRSASMRTDAVTPAQTSAALAAASAAAMTPRRKSSLSAPLTSHSMDAPQARAMSCRAKIVGTT